MAAHPPASTRSSHVSQINRLLVYLMPRKSLLLEIPGHTSKSPLTPLVILAVRRNHLEILPPSKRQRSPLLEAKEKRKMHNKFSYSLGENFYCISSSQAEITRNYGNHIKTRKKMKYRPSVRSGTKMCKFQKTSREYKEF